MQTESELLWLGFRFFGPSPLPLACGRMQTPTPTPTISTPPQYLLPLPCIAVCHGTPETEPPRSVFGFLGPSPLPWLAFVNAQLHHQNHIIHTSPALSPNPLSRRLPRHTRNRATTLGFRVFRPQPPPLARVCERPTLLSPPHYPYHPSTFPHRPVMPFATPHPKPSHHARVSGF